MPQTNFTYDGTTLQTYSVTTTGLYEILAAGAEGGSSSAMSGGEGAEAQVDISLTAGTVLDILVGGEGQAATRGGGGGGGGSFVVTVSFGTDVALVVAGGGGGTSTAGGSGATTSSSPSGGMYGVAAEGGAGGGGGGFTGNGETGSGYGGGGGSYTSGGAGGTNITVGDVILGGDGGYGGGGGGGASGGGGGYQGGNGGAVPNGTTADGGTGGGSYYAPSASSEQVVGDANTGNGSVSIELLACYRSGTRILTDRGEVVVEALSAGDLVRTASGALRPVVWLGHRTLDCAGHPRPWETWPIRVRPGAFGDGVPHSDLWLSPDHAVFVDGVLVPIRLLENGSTIAREPAETVTYWHIELASHDVLVAEGLPAESWLDTGNRAMFDNAPLAGAAPSADTGRVWSEHGCAELVERGPALQALRRRLSRRAAALGWRDLPALDVVVGGPGPLRIVVPPSVTRAHFISSSGHASGDRRRLGALLGDIRLESAPIASVCYASGFHAAENHGGAHLRWTDGEATLAIEGMPFTRVLEVEVACLQAQA